LGRRRDAAGAVRAPRKPGEALPLRKGLLRRGARVGCSSVSADGVAAAGVGVAGGGRLVRVGCRRSRIRTASGRRGVGGGAAAGAGPSALQMGRHSSGTGRDVPRGARGLRRTPRDRARRTELHRRLGKPVLDPS
jgi:hypothetical protein